MDPLVSIIFTSYNHSNYLSQALKSLVSQTYSNFELIIIDDCSTDGSQEILQEFQSQFPQKIKLHLLSKNTGSYVKASNFGAKMASGTYIIFAQCDDYSEVNQFERLVSVLEQNPDIGVVFSCSKLIDQNGNFIITDFDLRSSAFKRKCATDSVVPGKMMRNFLAHSCVIPNLSAAMVRKEILVQSGGLSDKYFVAADWAMWLDLSERTNFYYINEPLNNFRQHNTTIRSSIKAKNQISEIYSIFYSHIDKWNIGFMESLKFRLGVARIWLLYYFEGRRAFMMSFWELFRQFYKLDKLIVLYLLISSNIVFFETIKSRLSKQRR
jgi:glycosyltransferase involved in cell wall biosynthesis